MAIVNKEYRDRLFTFIFGREENRAWTLSLYNAVNGTNYDDPSALEITTIREVIYMGMHNDVSFIIGNELHLYEQQSTYNPNMPMRHAQYYCILLDSYCEKNGYDKYGKSLIPLPPPHFVTLYNGARNCEDDLVLRLSDSFPKGVAADMEVSVRMININYGHNKEMMKKCRPLMEYAWIVEEIRTRSKTLGIKAAVDSVIDDLPANFELRSYLCLHKLEVGTMLLTEYDEVKHHELIYANAFREGQEQGEAKGIASALLNIMQALQLTFEQAAEMLKIPKDDFGKYRDAVAHL